MALDLVDDGLLFFVNQESEKFGVIVKHRLQRVRNIVQPVVEEKTLVRAVHF